MAHGHDPHDESGHPAIPPGSPTNDLPGILLGLLLFTVMMTLLISAARAFPDPSAPSNVGPRLSAEPHALVVPMHAEL